MAQVPSSEVPGFADPSLLRQMQVARELGAEFPDNPLLPNGALTVQSVSRALPKWLAAKKRGAALPPRLLFFGESGIAGQGAGTGGQGLIGANPIGYVSKIAAAMEAQFSSFLGEQNAAAGGATPSQYDPRLTLGAGWAADAGPGHCGGRFIVGAGATAGTLDFRPGVPISEAVLWYPRVSSANTSVQVLIDDVVVDTFSQAGADAFLSRTYLMDLGLHKISVKGLGAGTAFVQGVVCRDSSSARPVVLQAGNCGRSISNLNGSAFPWDTKLSAAAMLPDLAVIKATVNDSNGGTSRLNYLLPLESIMSALSVTADLVVVVSFPSSNANTHNGGLDAIVRAIHDLASDFGASVIDAREVYGIKYTRAQARDLVFNTDHGNEVGYAAEAAQFMRVMGMSGL